MNKFNTYYESIMNEQKLDKKLFIEPTTAQRKKGESYLVYNKSTKDIIHPAVTRDSAKTIVKKYPELTYNSSSWVTDNL